MKYFLACLTINEIQLLQDLKIIHVKFGETPIPGKKIPKSNNDL